jgi:hypothetical protein
VFCAASDGFVRQALADVSSTAGFRQAAGTRGIKPRSDSSEESAILTVWVSSLSAMGPRLFLSARMTKPATLPQARWRIDILGLEDKHLGTVEAPAATANDASAWGWGWRGGWGWGGPGWGWRGGCCWGGPVAAGVVGGAIVAGAILATRPAGYAVYPGYAQPVYGPGCYWASQPILNPAGRIVGYTGQPVQVCPGYAPPPVASAGPPPAPPPQATLPPK